MMLWLKLSFRRKDLFLSESGLNVSILCDFLKEIWKVVVVFMVVKMVDKFLFGFKEIILLGRIDIKED